MTHILFQYLIILIYSTPTPSNYNHAQIFNKKYVSKLKTWIPPSPYSATCILLYQTGLEMYFMLN